MKIELSREEIERIVEWTEHLEGGIFLTWGEPKLDLPLQKKFREAFTPIQLDRSWVSIFNAAWALHHKRNGQVFQVVFQSVLGKAEKLDWKRFECNHIPFCLYWDRHGWQYCPETLMDWIDNGLQPPPPEPEVKTNSRVRRIGDRV